MARYLARRRGLTNRRSVNQHRIGKPGNDLIGAFAAGEFFVTIAPFKGENLLTFRRQTTHTDPFATRVGVNVINVAERDRFFR